jgi:hypothetical protein
VAKNIVLGRVAKAELKMDFKILVILGVLSSVVIVQANSNDTAIIQRCKRCVSNGTMAFYKLIFVTWSDPLYSCSETPNNSKSGMIIDFACDPGL